MTRSRGRQVSSLRVGLAALMATGALAAAILAKEGPPGNPAQAPLLRIAGALGMYDTAGDRARCFSNVKSITNAIQLYLTDYDRLPPTEHRTDAVGYFGSRRGVSKSRIPIAINCIDRANPYLRWPVVLDAYLPTREVWSCPSARMKSDKHWIVPGPDWLECQMRNEDKWGRELAVGPCMGAYPPGWGGTVTDSIAQDRLAVAGTSGEGTGAFSQSIGYSFTPGMRKSEAADPTWCVVCGDSSDEWLSSPVRLAYPDFCRLDTYGSAEAEWCVADWVNCPWTRDCALPAAEQARFRDDAALRRRCARHQGGSNIGFLDGHVAWMASDDIVASAPSCQCCSEESGHTSFTVRSDGRKLRGLCLNIWMPTGVPRG